MFSFAKTTLVSAVMAAALLAAMDASGVALYAQGKPVTPNFTVKDFVGTWNLMFHDRRFATMVLEQNDGVCTGTITGEWMNMDETGRITDAQARPGSSTIIRTSIKNGDLLVVQKDGDQELEWAMKLISTTTAEFRIQGADAPPNPEAIKLEKVWSEPPVQP